jgi:hypothetical protein
MKDILWIYLLDYSGSSILIYINDQEQIENPNRSVVSHFLYGLKEAAGEFEEDEINIMILDNALFFLIEEPITNSILVLKSKLQSNTELVSKKLRAIKDGFIEKFGEKANVLQHEREKFFSSFKMEVRQLIGSLEKNDSVKNKN